MIFGVNLIISGLYTSSEISHIIFHLAISNSLEVVQ